MLSVIGLTLMVWMTPSESEDSPTWFYWHNKLHVFYLKLEFNCGYGHLFIYFSNITRREQIPTSMVNTRLLSDQEIKNLVWSHNHILFRCKNLLTTPFVLEQCLHYFDCLAKKEVATKKKSQTLKVLWTTFSSGYSMRSLLHCFN